MGEHSYEGENHMSEPNGFADHAAPAAPVESKVKWGALAAYLGGVAALAVVNAVTGNDNQLLIAALPDVIEPFILPAIPAALSAIGGFFAKHTPRPDLGV
jgi:hypothetical protein